MSKSIAYDPNQNWILEDKGDSVRIVLLDQNSEIQDYLEIDLYDRDENKFATATGQKDGKNLFFARYDGKSIAIAVENFVGYLTHSDGPVRHGALAQAKDPNMVKRISWNFVRSILEPAAAPMELKAIRVIEYLDTQFCLDVNYLVKASPYDKVIRDWKYGESDKRHLQWFCIENDEGVQINLLNHDTRHMEAFLLPIGLYGVSQPRTSGDHYEIKLTVGGQYNLVLHMDNFLGVFSEDAGHSSMLWRDVDNIKDENVRDFLKAIEIVYPDGVSYELDCIHSFINGIPPYTGQRGFTTTLKNTTIH